MPVIVLYGPVRHVQIFYGSFLYDAYKQLVEYYQR